MATAFDILGAVSFAQGVLTLIAAWIAAFAAYTEELRSNAKRTQLVGEKLGAVTKVHMRANEIGILEADNPLSDSVGESVLRVQDLYEKTQNIYYTPAMERWRKSSSLSEELIKIASEAEQLAEHASFVLLEGRIQMMERKIDSLCTQVQRIADRMDGVLPVPAPQADPEKASAIDTSKD